MTDKVLNFIKENSLINSGDTVVCGLSGGADSVSLLMVLNELSPILDFKVEALHVNHSIRGEESDRDEQFCSKLCEKLQIPFTAIIYNVPEYAKEYSLSLEEAARKLRYSAFAEVSEGKLMATAHNANDNLETAVLNLTRGTGIKGLSGIPVKRDNIIRPLLTVTRCEIEEYLRNHGQDHVTDSTNLSDDYTRNMIRHQVVPVLEKINSSVITTSVNSFSTLREENSFISDLCSEAYSECKKGTSLVGLSKYHGVIRKRCIARLLTENHIPYSHDRLDKADELLMSSGQLNVSGDLFLKAKNGSIELIKLYASNEPQLLSADLNIGDNSIFKDKILHCEIVDCDNLKKIENVHKMLTFYMLDYDKIIGRAVVRNRRFGDRIQLKGRNFSSSVKKLINEKVPEKQRPELHFIEDEKGTIFAERIGIADRVKISENTARILMISIR